MGFLTWKDEHDVVHLYRTLPKELMDKIETECKTTFAEVLSTVPEGNYIYIDLPHAEVRLPPTSPNYALCDRVVPVDVPFPTGGPTCLRCIAVNDFLERNPWAMSSFV